MGKVRSASVVVAILLATVVVPSQTTPSRAQTPPKISCASSAVTSPSPGHYTGPWHSLGDYHFAVHFPASAGYPADDRDLEMKIIVDGRLDATVGADGQVSGRASGKVDAPIFHEGKQDISSGYGTIEGQISGTLPGSGSGLLLSHPVIDMHWGTFGGHAVETHPVMPDHQLSISGFDCISAQGTSIESGFPAMNVTNDSTGQLTRAEGVGTANGTWQLSNDEAGKYTELSHQVDSFMQQANALLDNHTMLDTRGFAERIIHPLETLVQNIRDHPNLSRCLLDRLGAWEASAVQSLFGRAQTLAISDALPQLREAAETLHAARQLNHDCAVSENGTQQLLLKQEDSLLDTAISSRNWPAVALLGREILLLGGRSAQEGLQRQIDRDIHALMQRSSKSLVLEVARMAYALGDDEDVAKAAKKPSKGDSSWPSTLPWLSGKKKASGTKSSKHGGIRKATRRAAPAKTLHQVLSQGVAAVEAQSVGQNFPTFSWRPVPQASDYVVFVSSTKPTRLLWAWSGSGTEVLYGDTALGGVPGTNAETASVPLASGSYTWSVLALAEGGRILAVKLRSGH